MHHVQKRAVCRVGPLEGPREPCLPLGTCRAHGRGGPWVGHIGGSALRGGDGDLTGCCTPLRPEVSPCLLADLEVHDPGDPASESVRVRRREVGESPPGCQVRLLNHVRLRDLAPDERGKPGAHECTEELSVALEEASQCDLVSGLGAADQFGIVVGPCSFAHSGPPESGGCYARGSPPATRIPPWPAGVRSERRSRAGGRFPCWCPLLAAIRHLETGQSLPTEK